MSNLFPVAGCRMYIGNAPMDTQATDFVAADFNSVTWIEIDGLSQIGALGDAGALITTALINRGRDFKQKGTANAGDMQCVFAQIDADAGQDAVLAAGDAANKNNYPFRLLLNDPTGSPATASKRMFVGLVTTAQEAFGEANTIRNLNVTIAINSNIVRVDAGE